MLKRLVILNSDIYSKADIELADCDSLQIVGPNNIGKRGILFIGQPRLNLKIFIFEEFKEITTKLHP